MDQKRPTLTIMLTWSTEKKLWELDWMQPLPADVGVFHGQLELESTVPLDALNARRVVAAVIAEMDSWLNLGW